MKKVISLLLAATLIAAVMLTFSGCGNGDYPVRVANVVIDKEPKNIVVLDPSAADIISYIGYDVKMIARSDEVDQEWLSVVPSIGSSSDPDIDAITEGNADVVFASENLSDSARKSLSDKEVMVITMSVAQTQAQVKTNYITLGKILGGEITGLKKAETSYDEFIGEMDEIKSAAESVNSDIVNTVCYLYSEDGQLKMMTNGTYADMLLGYTGAVNTAVNIYESDVDANTLKIANPSFILYDSEDTLNILKSNDTLKNLSAVKNNKTLMIPMEQLNRQGKTAIDTLTKIVEFMYPQLSANQTSADVKSNEQSTTAPTIGADESVAAEYKLELDDKLSLKPEDDNDKVKAMQQRLYDLGYITDKENITGYYGEVSKTAVKEFQKKNGIAETGTADNATLKVMFSEKAVKAK